MNALGHNLRQLRTAAALTQPQLAEKASIEQGYLSKLENGRASPSQDVLDRLAAALDVTPEQLTAAIPNRASPRMLIAGAVFGVLAVTVGLLMASGDAPPRPALSADAPFSLVAALDAAPEGVEVRALNGGEPGRMLAIRGIAGGERHVRAYLEVLGQFGQVHLVEIDPLPWWHFGSVNFDIMVRIPEAPPSA